MLGREKNRNLLIKLGGPAAAVTRVVGPFSDTERVKRGAMLEVRASRAERQRWRGVDGTKRIVPDDLPTCSIARHRCWTGWAGLCPNEHPNGLVQSGHAGGSRHPDPGEQPGHGGAEQPELWSWRFGDDASYQHRRRYDEPLRYPRTGNLIRRRAA